MIRTVRITGTTGGRASARFIPLDGEFTSSAGIDPDLPVGTEKQASGIAVPTAYTKFSGSDVNANAVAFITTPKVNNRIYVVLSNGKLLRYVGDFSGETLLGTFAGGNSGGAAYYNNYIYCFGTGNLLAYNTQTANFTIGQTVTGGSSGATGIITADADSGATGTLTLKSIAGTFTVGETITDGAGGSAKAGVTSGKTDVSRYGPLDGSPTFQNAWWTGLNLTPLTNTTYPVIRTISVPNHWGYVHSDDSLYFLDFAGGQGIVNRIHTMTGGGVQGRDDSSTVPSSYDVLDLPFGYYPTAICSYGTSVAIAAIQSVDDAFGINQGPAGLFIWDPTNETTFDQQVDFPDTLASALITRYGKLTCFSGSVQRGMRVAYYVGGTTFQEVAYIEDGVSPLAGAVDAQGDRLYFGSYCLEPIESASVWALGSRTSSNPNDIQNVAVVGTQTTSSDQLVTALKLTGQQNSRESNPQIAIGSSSTSTKELYRKTTGGSSTIASVWEGPLVGVGSNFRINRIRVPLGSPVASGTSITLGIKYDDGVTTETLSNYVINNTNFPSASRVTFKTPQMTGRGQNNFRLKFDWAGATVATPLNYPIDVEVEVFDDEPLIGV